MKAELYFKSKEFQIISVFVKAVSLFCAWF